jgi:hypothetical protein
MITNEEVIRLLGNDSPQGDTYAFILNGEVYINSDKLSVGSPIHELSHLILAYVKGQSPELYQ